MEKSKLAINQYKEEIIKSVLENQVTVIEAPTGSGKTTQIPQILFEAGLDKWGMIGVTQPRRIAAFGVSSRISQEMDAELGRLVGYKMRFDDMTGSHTKIKIMTDGILLEELRSDPLLERYSIIIVDEAHERSLNIDFILGLLKQIIKEREDFKVIVSSATINATLFSDYFNKAPIISVETKPYPIEEIYLPLKNNNDNDEQLQRVLQIVNEIETTTDDGDILIFLPGEGSIKDCASKLTVMNMKYNNHLEILPLYARLAPEEQNLVFNEFPGKRKVVIATNIAETSITIDGIVFVVDPGYAKINYYNPRTFTSFLELKPISKASCNQRRGRAGRTRPGKVYRLYSEEDLAKRDDYTREEIYRSDLSEVVLRMADLGIKNYKHFDFISPPNSGAINSAIDTLYQLDAIDENNNITELGKRMVDFPLGPRLSRILFEALLKYPSVTNHILIVLSYLSSKKPFLYPMGEEIESRNAQKKLSVKGGDFFSWINTFFKYQKAKDKDEFCKTYYLDTRVMGEIVNIHSQLCSMVTDRGFIIPDKSNYDQVILCLATGLRQFVCYNDRKRTNQYSSATEIGIRIHPGSFLYDAKPEWLIGGEIVNTGRTYVRSAALIPPKLVQKELSGIYDEIINKKQKSNRKKDAVKEYKVVSTSKMVKTEKAPDKITILDKHFDIVKDKAELLLHVPYEIIIQLKNKKDQILKMDFGNQRARLMYKNILILKDKMSALVQYFDKIDLDNGINYSWPKGEILIYPDDWHEIYKYIPFLMKPTSRSRKKKRAGFLSFYLNKDDSIEFLLDYDYFHAMENTLDSLRNLLEADIPAWTDDEKKVILGVYHKLLNLTEDDV